MTPTEIIQYDNGYDLAIAEPTNAQMAVGRANLPAAYLQGINDGLAGKARATGTVVPKAAPAAKPVAGGGVLVTPPQSNGTPGRRVQGGPPIVQPPAYNPDLPPGPRQFGVEKYLEVVAQTPLGPIRYDLAVGLENRDGGLILQIAKLLVRFEVLGDQPGDENRGFRLSGQDGALAQEVRALQAAKRIGKPANYRLDAWYGAKTGRGIRLIGRAELDALGIPALDNPILSLKQGLPADYRNRGGNL